MKIRFWSKTWIFSSVMIFVYFFEINFLTSKDIIILSFTTGTCYITIDTFEVFSTFLNISVNFTIILHPKIGRLFE